MKQNPLLLPLIGSGLTIFCYFLPWITIDISTLSSRDTYLEFEANIIAEGNITASGLNLAFDSANLFTLAFLGAIGIIAICIYMLYQKTPLKSRTPVLVCSGIGLLIVLLIILINMTIINFGAIGAAIGFIIALIGAWSILKSEPAIDTSESDA